jgi:hypothetical protein
MAAAPEVLVVKPGLLRVVLVSAGLILSALLLLFWAAGVVLLAGMIDFILVQIGLILVALGAAAIAVYLLLLLHTLALRIELNPERLKLRLPRMRGHLALPGLIHAELPYEAIASVQRRAEIFSSFGGTKVQYAFSLITRDDGRLPLGFMIENAAFQYPFDRVVKMIATRAACPEIESRAVRVGSILGAMIHGTPAWTSA